MRILITNDDGVEAPGLRALFEAVRDLGEVAVAAPSRPCSAMSHSISLHAPFRAERLDWEGAAAAFRVESTPADCVRLAVLRLLPFRPDVVLSGVNQGANYGTLVLYSGTVAAAAEACLLGIPSAAVSLASYAHHDFTAAARYARRLAGFLAERGLPEGVWLNVNVPPLPEEKIRGAVLARQGLFRHVEDLVADSGGGGEHYRYLLDSPFHPAEEHPETDVQRVREGFIAVTPLALDRTAREHFPHFADWPWGDDP